ncbi:MAG TPA: helix-turn-helix domain-containing protein [Methanomassiliicoccales archaeon]|jgi:DNA-binding HxlR family transcriptional regulator
MEDPYPEPKHAECPIEATVMMIGGKWKTVILWKLRDDKLRFNQLMTEMPDISPKMLTKQLRELEHDGLVTRKMYPEIPPRVEYSLTPKAISLVPIMIDMARWGVANIDGRSWMGCPSNCRCALKK